jgi:hypothetical protein
MVRAVELALFLAPIALFLVWRFMSQEEGPSLRVVVGAACVVAVLAGALVWLSREHALPPGASYEPARLHDGRVISGHADR